jgi:ankyrin repeat protein
MSALVAPVVEPSLPIWEAAIGGHWNIVKQWLRYDPSLIAIVDWADFPDKYAYKVNLLHLAATFNSDVGLLKYLVSLGADVNAVPDNEDSKSPLHFAATYNSVDVLQCLISQGADVHAKNDYAYTPLHNAVAVNPNVDVLQCLVSHGADVNAMSTYCGTPLHNAVKNNTMAALKYLVSQGADIHAKDHYGRIPLHIAAWYNSNVEVLKYFVSLGADANARAHCNSVPLHYAASDN